MTLYPTKKCDHCNNKLPINNTIEMTSKDDYYFGYIPLNSVCTSTKSRTAERKEYDIIQEIRLYLHAKKKMTLCSICYNYIITGQTWYMKHTNEIPQCL